MDTLTEYEKQLGFNALTRWLHSLRYRDTIEIVRGLSRNGPVRILEIGSAHGKLFDFLNERFPIDYTGVELDKQFAVEALRRHGRHRNFSVLNRSAVDLSGIPRPDIIIALETLEHIPGPDVVRIVESIAALRPKLFICSVPVEVGPAIWLKNVGSALAGYNRHQIEYNWRRTMWAGLYQLDRLPPHDCGHMGFDWRWLAQTIRHNMRIRETRRFPMRFLPAAVSTSVFMIAEPR
jgi:hypothetical protein